VARVLVIEDHPDTLELVRAVLAHAGHDVSVAADGDEGLRLTISAGWSARGTVKEVLAGD
jgi:DNA-binding response OmpR family regulator